MIRKSNKYNVYSFMDADLINHLCIVQAGKPSEWYFQRAWTSGRYGLHDTNRQRFTRLFGRHNFILRTPHGLEYVWEFAFEGSTFFARTTGDTTTRGTSYDMVNDGIYKNVGGTHHTISDESFGASYKFERFLKEFSEKIGEK